MKHCRHNSHFVCVKQCRGSKDIVKGVAWQCTSLMSHETVKSDLLKWRYSSSDIALRNCWWTLQQLNLSLWSPINPKVVHEVITKSIFNQDCRGCYLKRLVGITYESVRALVICFTGIFSIWKHTFILLGSFFGIKNFIRHKKTYFKKY